MRLRGHHLVCIPRYRGGSYDKKSANRFTLMQKRFRANPNLKVKIIIGTDFGCIACPHYKNKKCIKRKGIHEKLLNFDRQVLKKLKLKRNKIYKAKDVFLLSVKKIQDKEMKKFCKGCEFLNYCLKHGINKSFINDLK